MHRWSTRCEGNGSLRGLGILLLTGCPFCETRSAAQDPNAADPGQAPQVFRGGIRLDDNSAMAVDYRTKWAVIIGIDQYDEAKTRLRPLTFAANDARAI